MNINLLTITLFIKHVVLYSCCKQTEHIRQYERALLEQSAVYALCICLKMNTDIIQSAQHRKCFSYTSTKASQYWCWKTPGCWHSKVAVITRKILFIFLAHVENIFESSLRLLHFFLHCHVVMLQRTKKHRLKLIVQTFSCGYTANLRFNNVQNQDVVPAGTNEFGVRKVSGHFNHLQGCLQ